MRKLKHMTPLSILNLLSNVVDILLFTFVFLAILPGGAMADEKVATPERVSAEAFAAQVRAANPQLLIRETAVDVAAAEVIEAKRLDNPSIAYDREEVFDEGDGLGENQLRLAFPIEISGRRGLLIKSAEEGVTAARLEAAAARIDLVSASLKIYYRTAAWRQRLRLLETSKQSLTALLQTVRDRVEEGDASGYDLSRVELEVLTLEDLIAEARRELARGRLLLGALAGTPGIPLDATDELAPVTPPASAPPGTSSPHPRLTAVRHRITSHNLARDAAGRKRVPSLTLTGGMKTAPDGNDTLFGYVAGVALTLPFFDAGRGERERAAAEMKRAQAELTVAEHRITSKIAVTRETLRQVVAQTKQFEKEQLPRIDKLLTTAEYSFKEGERPVFELLDAHRTVRELHLRHLDLLLSAHSSLIDLNAALGRKPGEE